jgi:hypothetical protein
VRPPFSHVHGPSTSALERPAPKKRQSPHESHCTQSIRPARAIGAAPPRERERPLLLRFMLRREPPPPPGEARGASAPPSQPSGSRFWWGEPCFPPLPSAAHLPGGGPAARAVARYTAISAW